jgi:hypothetical protein
MDAASCSRRSALKSSPRIGSEPNSVIESEEETEKKGKT